MRREPVISIAIVASVVIALLEGIAAGDVNSATEWIGIAIPILFGAIQRALVTPVEPV